MRTSTLPVISFFRRKPLPGQYFSIEILFDELIKYLPNDFVYRNVESKRFSKGVLSRLMNMMEAAREQTDINHITGDVHFLALFMRSQNTVLTIHDCRFLEHPNPVYRGLLKMFWLTLPLKKIKYVTVVSEKTRNDILNNSTANPDQIRVIPNFVFSYFKKQEPTQKRTKPVILQIGTSYNKNIERVAAALCGLDCTLEIIGKPNEVQTKMLNDHSIDYTVFTNLSNEEVYHRYCNCDILLFASTYEGFGLPIIEAQTVGRPVITSNLDPMIEVAGGAALLVDPFSVDSIRNAVIQLMNNSELKRTLVEKGRENARTYQVERVAAAYHALYHEILNTNRNQN